MEDKFKLIKSVNPRKIPIRINEKFAKLTLSSKKKDVYDARQTEMVNKSDDENDNSVSYSLSRKSAVSRALLRELLTDDDSESEADELNRLFLSKTTQKTDAIKTKTASNLSKSNEKSIEKGILNEFDKPSMMFSERLEVSNSDETHFSLISDVNDNDNAMNNKKITNKNQLQVSLDTSINEVEKGTKHQESSEDLFGTHGNSNLKEEIDILSVQIKSLGVNCFDVNGESRLKRNEEIADADTISITSSFVFSSFDHENKEQPNTESQVQPMIDQKVAEADTISTANESISIENNHRNSYSHPFFFPKREILDIDNNEFNNTVYTVSSTSSRKTSLNISETDENDESDIVIVIDSSNSESEMSNIQVSDVKSSNDEIPLPTTLDNVREHRLEQFLKDISLKQAENEHISGLTPVSSKIMKYQHTDIDESLPEDSLNIIETSHEEERSQYRNNKEIKQSENIINDNDEDQNERSENKAQSISLKSGILSEKTETSLTPQTLKNMQSNVEKINISAKIKIKLHIKEPIIKYSSENDDFTEKNENVQEQNKSNSDDVLESNGNQNDSVEESDKHIEHIKSTKTTMSNIRNNQIKDKAKSKYLQTESENEIDEKAKDLLTKLYGSEWRTPEVIQKLNKKMNTSRRDEDSYVDNFTRFHNNILPDFQSTKLNGIFNIDSPPTFKKPATEVKPIRENLNSSIGNKKSNKCNDKKELELESHFEIKSTRKVKQKPLRRYAILSSSSSENESKNDFDSCSDVSWNESKTSSLSSSDSSDNEDFGKTKKSSRSTRKKKSNKIVYLDLTNDYITVQKEYKSPAANNDEKFHKKLDTLLESCQYKEKDKLLYTTPQSNTKTRRKLFTPKYDDDLIENLKDKIEQLEDTYSISKNDDYDEYDESNSVKLKYPLPLTFGLINKQIEAVKTGTPIFKSIPGKEGDGGNTSSKKKNAEKCISLNEKNCNENTPTEKQIKIPALDKTLEIPPNKYGFLRSLDMTISKVFSHPEALYYKENFKTKKNELTQKLYKLFNEEVFDNKLDVQITWNKKLLTTAGRCINKKSLGKRCSRIELSEKVLTSADRLRCTLIHELCHAATWLNNGEHGHSATWKKWAAKANTIFPELPKIGVCHQYDIEYKYTYKCTLCQAKSYAHSKSKKIENIRCAYCHGTIEVYLNRKNKNGVVMHTPVREPTGFAKFVKEKYKFYKTPNRNHGEVMKLLSKEFASLDIKEKE